MLYEDVLETALLSIHADHLEAVTVKASPVSDRAIVTQMVGKLRSKYGAGEVDRYYSKLDAALEVAL